jgi:hypothetical protein
MLYALVRVYACMWPPGLGARIMHLDAAVGLHVNFHMICIHVHKPLVHLSTIM